MNVMARTSSRVETFGDFASRVSSSRGRGPDAAEVMVMWNQTCIRAEHCTFTGKKAQGFSIGEDPVCDFPVPAEYLSGSSKLNLLHGEAGAPIVTVPATAKGEVIYPDGSIITLAELFAHRKEQLNDQGAPLFKLPVESGTKLVVEIGPFTFLVRSAATERYAAPLKLSLANSRFAGLSFVAHAVFFVLISLVPPDANGLITDPSDQSNRFMKYMVTPTQARMEQVPEMLEKPDKDANKSQEVGKAHAGTSGAMGDRTAKRNNTRAGIKGPADTKHPVMAREMARELAGSAGILQYLSNQNAPVSPFGAATALGRDPENALGGLMGDTIGNSFGYGGLGVYGTGRGGGGDGRGTFGVGNLSFIGPGYGPKGGPDGMPAPDLRPGKHRPTGPIVRDTGTVVKGSIPKEVIRRLVRRQQNQIKYCYEKGLTRNAGLEGRVTVRFMIDANGAVKVAAVASSSLGDTAVEQCIANTVGRITFPRPEDGGLVMVNYPFTLTSPNQ